MENLLARIIGLTSLIVICAVCSIHSQNTSPPSIVLQPVPSRGYDIYIMDKRKPIRLDCDASGTPPPTYKWIKYDLDGTNPTELDPNDERITITDGNLVVTDPETSAMAGADPEELERVSEADEGLYQCIAENTFGSALSKKVSARLAFLDPFDWVENKRITAQVGEKVVLNCDPPDGVPASITALYWSFGTPPAPPRNPVELNDRVLQDAKGNLVFANVQPEDGKDYMCNVPNHHIGEAKTSPIFEVMVNTNRPAPDRAPAWVDKPSSTVEVLRTKILTLKCIAEGNPTPAISWRRGGGEEIPIDRINNGNGPQGATLEIRDITFDDDGEYICEAENGGAPITATASVTVRSAPYWDPSPPSDTTIAPKESVTITCQAGGSPAASISWLINGKPESELAPNPRRRVEPGQGSGQIIVTNAEQSDSAVFQCVAKNAYGEEITSVFLNVLAIPAEIRKRPQANYEVAEGSTVEMRCEPYGRPNPTVTWSFDGQTILPGGRHTIAEDGSDEGMLTITDVTVGDDGMYNCNVTNDFGTDAASPRLIVRMQTTVTEGPGDIEVMANENIVLKCVIQSDPELELTVTWDFEGVEIDVDNNKNRYKLGGDNSLTVITARKEDGGDYTCKAITTFSQDEASGTVIVLTIPDPPINVAVQNANGLNVDVQWTPGYHGNTDITEYTIEYKTDYREWETMTSIPASSTSETVDLKAYNKYTFRVKATNKVGVSGPSEESSKYTTPERAPIINPDKVTGSGPEPGLMVVTWDPMDAEDYAGPDFKYIVRYRAKGELEWTEEEVKNKNSHEVRSDIAFQEYEVQVVSENAVGRCESPVETQTGFSGESEPTAAPSDVAAEVVGPDTIRLTWVDVPEDTINGKVLWYRAFFSIVIAANSEEEYNCESSPCVINQLKPYSDYSLQLAVVNGKGVGPKSSPAITFKTDEGVPSTVNNLAVKASSDRILAVWEKPDSYNGVLIGYRLTHELMMGMVIEDTTHIDISEPDTTRLIIDDLKPDNKYKITVVAKTGSGAGEASWQETRTSPKGIPTPPGKPGFADIGPNSVNVTYTLPKEGPAADYISVKYYKKGDDESTAKMAGPIDIFEEDYVHVPGLNQNTKYVFQLVAKNDHGESTGKWEDQKTSGTGAVGAGGFKVEAWFVILIVIIILLLLILLIICVLKSQKGGKYNVSDKEQQLKGDIESTPLKDEGGFEEFQPRDGNLDDNAPLTGGSHPSLNESEAGSSETDSLKEYAEGDTGKFNEEGSFIGQYGDRKTRPPEGEQDGAAYSTFV